MSQHNRIADLRKEYARESLDAHDVARDPFLQFSRWFQEALNANLPEPNAMTLATTGADGQPSARIVLLKGYDDRGFVFYTNYQSRKSREIAENNAVCLLFYWGPLERQVRILGKVSRVSESESDEYFQSRPIGHQLGAWASNQSAIISGREALEENLARIAKRFELGPVPRPPHWGGFRVKPSLFEFWQGRSNRLHDRLEYAPSADGWAIRRLSP
jgi:pyridoxamine 5'-phosphate oxidase